MKILWVLWFQALALHRSSDEYYSESTAIDEHNFAKLTTILFQHNFPGKNLIFR